MAGTLSDGVGIIALDEQHQIARQKIRSELPSGPMPEEDDVLAYLALGFVNGQWDLDLVLGFVAVMKELLCHYLASLLY